MIIDELKNAALYKKMSPGIADALDYLCNTDFSQIAKGRHEIDGSRMYALVNEYESLPREKGVWEAHRQYIDVQYIYEGVEQIGYAPLDSLKITQAYSAEKDCLLLEGQGDLLTMREGYFAVFFPRDAHMPGLALKGPAPVKKIVVKVACQ
ncbi:MAG: YhcH/YjgK/YiaL family protein [Candidatus Margulisbacteria bacterium]|nr:YhcH/YjgK/YiaL family protein [Candidatus Margulisiibacteriota bacterium]